MVKEKVKWSCPECLSREVRYRPTLGTFYCRRCGHVFEMGSHKAAKTVGKKGVKK